LTNQSFLYHPIGCTAFHTNLIIRQQNHPLFFSLGGWLEEKNRINKIGKYVGDIKQICEKLFVTLRTIF